MFDETTLVYNTFNILIETLDRQTKDNVIAKVTPFMKPLNNKYNIMTRGGANFDAKWIFVFKVIFTCFLFLLLARALSKIGGIYSIFSMLTFQQVYHQVIILVLQLASIFNTIIIQMKIPDNRPAHNQMIDFSEVND